MPGRKSMISGGAGGGNAAARRRTIKLSKSEAAKAIRLINAVADGKYDSGKQLPGWMMSFLKPK